MSAPDWWRGFFSGVAVDLWLQFPTEEMTRSEVDFIEKTLGLAPGANVLDVPCGGGRHAIELASRGYRVVGVDLSADFLKEARAQTASRSLPVSWEQREMRDLPWEAHFDGIFCFGNSFAYLDDDGNANFLKAVARALKPGARFVLQTGTVTEAFLPAFQERGWYQIGDILFLILNRFDHVHSRVETEYTFVRNGAVEKRSGSQRVYSFSELCRLLQDAGFTNCEGYSSLNQEPFRLGSQGAYLVAVKPGAREDDKVTR